MNIFEKVAVKKNSKNFLKFGMFPIGANIHETKLSFLIGFLYGDTSPLAMNHFCYELLSSFGDAVVAEQCWH